MSLIKIANLSFAYPGQDKIFDNISLQLDSEWKIGLIGRNGRGKTTLLSILEGTLEYSGSISSSESFRYFPFRTENEYRSSYEIMKDAAPDAQEWEAEKELSLLDIDEEVLSRPFSSLSSGERMKIQLASLFLSAGSFFLIDEPTNHLDIKGREVVSSYLNMKKGFMLVSHDRYFLDRCTDHILSLNRSDTELQRGNYSSWQQNKDYSDSFELAQNNKLLKEIKRLTEASVRTAKWSDAVEKTKYASQNSGLKADRGYIGHKSAKMMKRAKVTEERASKSAEEKSKLLKNIETSQNLMIRNLEYHSERLVLADGLSVCLGGRKIIDNISFEIKNGSRTVISGSNGSGKSTLLKLIAGKSGQAEFSGELRVPGSLIISYVAQETSMLSGDLHMYAVSEGIDETVFMTNLDKLAFTKDNFRTQLQDLSDGQKKKILLAASLSRSAHLYIWDEPLNYTDIISRIQIENLILEYRPAMILVEHDRSFIENTATDYIFLD